MWETKINNTPQILECTSDIEPSSYPRPPAPGEKHQKVQGTWGYRDSNWSFQGKPGPCGHELHSLERKLCFELRPLSMVSRDGFSFSEESMRFFFAFLCEMGFQDQRTNTHFVSFCFIALMGGSKVQYVTFEMSMIKNGLRIGVEAQWCSACLARVRHWV